MQLPPERRLTRGALRPSRQGQSELGSRHPVGRTCLSAVAGPFTRVRNATPAYQWRKRFEPFHVHGNRTAPGTVCRGVKQPQLLGAASAVVRTGRLAAPCSHPSRLARTRLLDLRLVIGNSCGGSTGIGDGAAAGGAAADTLRAAVGIDLGTTTSAVAVVGPDGRPVVVEDEEGRAVIPSVVHVRQDGTVLVGDEAVAAAESDPSNAFYGIKRLMGRTYGEASQELDEWSARATTSASASASPWQSPSLQGARGRLRSYSLAEGPGGQVEVVCPALGRNLSPQEVSAHLLRHLVSRAAAFLARQRPQQPGDGGEQGGGVQVLDAVITVPAHFNPRQRRAVSEAARAAGLQRITLLQEPIAAAMAYGFGSPQVPYDVLLVFDLGGGTLDLTIVEAFEGIMEVLSTSGDNYLGGDDFTAAVADWLSLQLREQQQHKDLAELPPSTTSASVPPSRSPPESKLACASTPSCAPAGHHGQLPTTSASSPHSLALLRAAEAAKLALSEAVAAARGEKRSSNSASCSSSSNSNSGGGDVRERRVSVRVRLPAQGLQPCASGAGLVARPTVQGSQPTDALGVSQEAELTLATFEELVRPLLRRMWWPLEEVALSTRTQLGGRLPPHLDPRASEAGSGSGSGSASGSRSAESGSASTSVWDMEGPGRREGATTWEFSIFPPEAGSGAAAAGAKYVAPPRRLSGLVLVGAATRLPVVRDYITEVTGLPVRPGVDPETAVALGAAVHAGLMVGDVARGIEMNDGGYVAGQHGRASGFQVAVQGSRGSLEVPAEEAEPELIWEP